MLRRKPQSKIEKLTQRLEALTEAIQPTPPKKRVSTKKRVVVSTVTAAGLLVAAAVVKDRQAA